MTIHKSYEVQWQLEIITISISLTTIKEVSFIAVARERCHPYFISIGARSLAAKFICSGLFGNKLLAVSKVRKPYNYLWLYAVLCVAKYTILPTASQPAHQPACFP